MRECVRVCECACEGVSHSYKTFQTLYITHYLSSTVIAHLTDVHTTILLHNVHAPNYVHVHPMYEGHLCT